MTFETDFNKYFQDKKFSQLATELKVGGSSRQAALTKLGNVKNKDKILDTMVDVFENAPIVIKRVEGDKFASTQITYDVADKIYVLSSLESPISSLVKDLGETQADGILQDPRQQVEVALFKLFSNDKGNFQALGEAKPTVKPSPSPSPTTPVNKKPTVTATINAKLLTTDKPNLNITKDVLSASDTETKNPAKLTYTLGEVTGGTIWKSGPLNGSIKEGSTFTQKDIDAGKIKFTWNGKTAENVGFKFELKDDSASPEKADSTSLSIAVTPPVAKPTPTTKPAQNTKPTVTTTTNAKLLTTDKPNLNITKDVLSASDNETKDAAKLTYTLDEITGGELFKENQQLNKDSAFTEKDINDNKIKFTWDGKTNNNVGFKFELKDDSASPERADSTSLSIAVTPPAVEKVAEKPRQPVPAVLPLPINTDQQQPNPQSKKPVTPSGGSPTTTTIQSTTNQEKVVAKISTKDKPILQSAGVKFDPADSTNVNPQSAILLGFQLRKNKLVQVPYDGNIRPEQIAALKDPNNANQLKSIKDYVSNDANLKNYGYMFANGETNEKYKNKIKAIQTALNVPVDGIYGARTEAAVLAYQEDKKIRKDGICGPETLTELMKNNNEFKTAFNS